MKRYDLQAWGEGDYGLDTDETAHGEWVKFDEADAEIKRIQSDLMWTLQEKVTMRERGTVGFLIQTNFAAYSTSDERSDSVLGAIRDLREEQRAILEEKNKLSKKES
jgi:hypothetical protein